MYDKAETLASPTSGDNALVLGFAALYPPLLAQDKSLVWDRFDVDLVINQNGTVDVQEHQTIRFTNGTFSFGYQGSAHE